MNSAWSFSLGLWLLVAASPCHAFDLPSDYANFVALPEKEKRKIVWELFEQKKWGDPGQKPVCRDLLATQGYSSDDGPGWASQAIDLAEAQGWTDLSPLIVAIYKAPKAPWIYQRAFLYLRTQSAKPVSDKIKASAEILIAAGRYKSPITDTQIASAKETLLADPDEEAVLVYALGVALTFPGKGGTDRGRQAASDVLAGLDPNTVKRRLFQLRRDGIKYIQSEIEWVAHYLSIPLENPTP